MRKALAWFLRRVSGTAFAVAQKASYATYLLEKKANETRHPETNRNLFESNL